MAGNNANDKVAVKATKGEEAAYLSEIKALIAGEAGERERQDERGKQVERESAARFRRGPGVHSADQALHAETEEDMIKIVSAHQGMEFVDLSSLNLDQEKVRDLIRQLGGDLVRAYGILPLRELEDGTLEVAISDPLDITVADNLRLLTDRQITTLVANENDIHDYIEMIWGVGDEDLQTILDESEDAVDGLELTKGDLSIELDGDLLTLANQPPVIRLVNSYLMQAIQDRASDFHIEPYRGYVRVRYRVDGVLRELPDPPTHMQLGLCSRLKVLANMNITEQRMPQDGRIRLTLEGREVDLRVSTLPTVHGESIVMRVLDKSMMMLGIEQLGMPPKMLEEFSEIIARPNGIVLVCGPTGCGKTTTLYAALAAVNDPSLKIITTEDPVEYQLPGIVQVNINPAVGLTFATCLRSILRQDPDNILVGEIRDVETATIAIQAALTGHLVFSTLHSNSAASCVTRLVDMGLEPFLLTSTMQSIVGQRLVRTTCPSCAEPYAPTDEELEDFGVTRDELGEEHKLLMGAGCDECTHTGYKGRLGIFEHFIFTEEICDLVLERATTDQIHAMAVQRGMQTMRRDGWRKICAGITSFEEVARQTPRENREQIRMEMQYAVAGEAEAPLEPAPGEEDEYRPVGKLSAPWEKEMAARLK